MALPSIPLRYVEIAGEHGTLRGFWQPSAVGANAASPAVVMLHGLTGTNVANGSIFVGQARRLAAAGIAVLRMDFFGSGNSDGEHTDMSIWTELSDAQRMFKYAAAQSEIDSARIGILGYSFGGGIAALLTGVEPRLKSLVGWSPAVMGTLNLNSSANAGNTELPSFGGVQLGEALVRSAYEAKPLDALSRFSQPTLVIHGDQDETVPLGSGALFAEKSGGQLHIITGANHGYENPAWRDELYEVTTRHFVETL